MCAPILLLGLLALGALGSCRPDCDYLGQAGQLCGPREATLPMLADGPPLPIVEGRLDGKPARFLLDTGATSTIVSATLLGVPGDHWVTVPSLCLGALCLDTPRVWAKDSPFSQPQPGQLSGLIGLDALAQFLVELDHGDRVTLRRQGSPCAGDARPLTLDKEGRPFLEASLDGQALGGVLLDTGAAYTLLSNEAAAKAPYLTETAVSTGGCSINGCTDTGNFTSTARRFCVGELCRDGLGVKYPVWDAVGGTFLRAFRTNIDLRGHSIVFCR
jgi:hypothetical protein